MLRVYPLPLGEKDFVTLIECAHRGYSWDGLGKKLRKDPAELRRAVEAVMPSFAARITKQSELLAERAKNTNLT